MFTGIIEVLGTVRSLRTTQAGVRLAIEPGPWSYQPALGDSVAVNGCCLTIATPPAPGRAWEFDAIPETLAKTTLGTFREGQAVNLEHAATASTLLGGHVVQGHVDGTAVVESVQTTDQWRVRLRPPEACMPYIVPKGSVTLDGVSLTIADVDPKAGWFEVALIPTTLAKTTLKDLRPGVRCNIECDTMAKTIVHYLRHFLAEGNARA